VSGWVSDPVNPSTPVLGTSPWSSQGAAQSNSGHGSSSVISTDNLVVCHHLACNHVVLQW
jgi:hypothetical protein